MSNSKKYPQLMNAAWLLGMWEYNLPEGSLVEMWVPRNDSTIAGMGLIILNQDTVFSDEIEIKQVKDTLFYISINRSTGKPVRFKLSSSTESLLVFENPQHDFPQKISYRKLAADSLVAEISGRKDGRPLSQMFPMRKTR